MKLKSESESIPTHCMQGPPLWPEINQMEGKVKSKSESIPTHCMQDPPFWPEINRLKGM